MISMMTGAMGAMWTKMPKGVFFWVNAVLAPTNMAAIVLAFVHPHPVFTWTAIAFAFAVVPNFVMLAKWWGMSRAMSIPHLPPWLALEAYLVYRLFGPVPLTSADDPLVYGYALLVVGVNLVSILFDFVDSYRWLSGKDRELIAFTTPKPV